MDVLLVDDHPILHQTIGAVVRSIIPDVDLHSEMDLGGALSRAHQLKTLELVLLDLGLPGYSGIEALERFRKALPRIRVAVISATEDQDSVRAALDAGAVGYIPKTSLPKVMADALRLILGGGVYIPPQAILPVQPARTPPKLSDLRITKRQGDVLRLLAKGLPNSEIARELDISPNTVKQHVHSAFRALGVTSRTEAMVVLAKMGIKEKED